MLKETEGRVFQAKNAGPGKCSEACHPASFHDTAQRMWSKETTKDDTGKETSQGAWVMPEGYMGLSHPSHFQDTHLYVCSVLGTKHSLVAAGSLPLLGSRKIMWRNSECSLNYQGTIYTSAGLNLFGGSGKASRLLVAYLGWASRYNLPKLW